MLDDQEEKQAATTSIDDFESQVKGGSTNSYPYDQLMIAYRKEKKYLDELRIVKHAIAVFGAQLKKMQQGTLKGNRKRSSILALSKSISQKTGMVDKKGSATYISEPIARWQKRMAIIEKKIKPDSSKNPKKK